MDIQSLLQPFFQYGASFLPGSGLVAAILAQMVYGVLKDINFDAGKALEQLGKIGFKIGQALLPDLLKAAKAGVENLTEWFQANLKKSPELNEASARVLVDQAEPIATAIEQAQPDKKEKLAEKAQEGLQDYGGATAEIADPYAEVIKDLSKLNELAALMRQKTEAWANQTIEAKRSSLIENVEQSIEGGAGGKQVIRAEDDSTVSNVTQIVHGRLPGDPTTDAPPPKDTKRG